MALVAHARPPAGPIAALQLACALVALLPPLVARAAAPPPPAPRAPPAEKRAAAISVDPPSDAAIERRIEDILAALQGTEALSVRVRSGVVRVSGRADSLAVREQVGALAERVDGVVLVLNEVQVASDVRDRLGPTWTRVTGYLANGLGHLPVVAVALLSFVAFALLGNAIGRWERPFPRLGLSDLGANVLRVTLRAMLLMLGLVIALDLLGLLTFIGAVVGTLGLFGVVAGIALRDVISSYLPGIMLGLHPPFGPGDRVKIGAHEGRVVRVTSRETVLVQNDGQHLRIPNVSLLQEAIVNFERHRERRIQLPVVLALSADLRRAQDEGLEALRAVPGILPAPGPSMRVLAVDADRVRVAFYAWMDQTATSFPDLESRARQALQEALLSADVRFPLQEIAVHHRSREAETKWLDEGSDGDEAALLAAHVREELATPGERDLLREARPHRKQ